jgi:nucleoid DNA-binding protein
MTKRELVAEVSARTRGPRSTTSVIVDEFLATVGRALSEGYEVHLRRFGTFALRARGPRSMRNPRSGNAIKVPGKLVPVFRSSKSLNTTVDGRQG